MLPAVVARLAAERWLARFLGPVARIHSIFEPLVRVQALAGGIVATLFGGREERSNADIVEEEIRSAVEEGQREGLLETQDLHMIESIMEYRDVEVSEVMTPRTEMVALDLDATLEDNLERIMECGHSRIPVYRGTKDRIVRRPLRQGFAEVLAAARGDRPR